MHIPSERVYNEMRSEEAALWVVPANGGDDLAVLIKAPSSCIKALIAGCDLTVYLGISDGYLCAGVRIFDMPDAPVFISGAVREGEEQTALHMLLEKKMSPAFLFNEMDVCLAWTNLSIAQEAAGVATEFLGHMPDPYVGPFTSACAQALDNFCSSVDPTPRYENAKSIPVINVPVLLETWRANNVHFISIHGSHAITIDDPNEGEMFERAIWASLESVFPLTLHKSPEVQIGDSRREFTDVLSYYERGSFLIEAKDISVLSAGYGKSQERRTKGVQKQVIKAIGQLIGASKALKRGELIFTKDGKKLSPERDEPPHCVVLITELMHWGDWSEVEAALQKAMQDTGAFFHLFDLREFIQILKGCRGNPMLFDYNLVERCKLFVEKNSIFIRTSLVAAPNTGGEAKVSSNTNDA